MISDLVTIWISVSSDEAPLDIQFCEEKQRRGQEGGHEESNSGENEGLTLRWNRLEIRRIDDNLWSWDLDWCRVNNKEESVHRDQDDGEGREEDAAGLGGPDQLAEVLHVLTQGPVLAAKSRK